MNSPEHVSNTSYRKRQNLEKRFICLYKGKRLVCQKSVRKNTLWIGNLPYGFDQDKDGPELKAYLEKQCSKTIYSLKCRGKVVLYSKRKANLCWESENL